MTEQYTDSNQESQSQNYSILFEKMDEIRITHGELWIVDTNCQSGLPPEIEQIKRIVDACNFQEPITLMTRS